MSRSKATCLYFFRCAINALTSTSSNKVTCGAVCLLFTIALEIAFRIGVIFSRVSNSGVSETYGLTGVGAGASLAAGAVVAGVAAGLAPVAAGAPV